MHVHFPNWQSLLTQLIVSESSLLRCCCNAATTGKVDISRRWCDVQEGESGRKRGREERAVEGQPSAVALVKERRDFGPTIPANKAIKD